MDYVKPQRYYEGLNGLRAISIILVLIFHGKIEFIGKYLGWVGVDLFFVISGFLITGILLNSKRDSRYFQKFYIRRVLRIFPIYYLVVIGVCLFYLMLEKEGAGFIYYLTYLQNFFVAITNSGYGLLGHTWSLAVEEQFYLFWPFVVYLTSIRNLKKISFILIAFVPLIRFYFSLNGYHIFYQNSLIISRADTMAIGSIIAILIHSENITISRMRLLSYLLISSGLVCSLLLLHFIGNNISGNGIIGGWISCKGGLFLEVPYGHLLFTAIGFISAGLIMKVVFKTSKISSFVSSVFENKIINYIGTISYGLYLFHWPIFLIVDQIAIKFHFDLNIHLIFLVKLLLSFIVSSISWHYFESWFISKKNLIAKYDSSI